MRAEIRYEFSVGPQLAFPPFPNWHQQANTSPSSPFGRETRLDLASTHYRRIIEAMTRVDRILKPMWPQHFQQIVFDIKGLPPPLQLTSGNDLGGVERSLAAYCAAFHVDMPRWTVDWQASSQPAFRLLPLEDAQYSPLQLMAVFRALRYNSFFKAISFRDVDLSPLAGRKDYSPFGEGVVCASLNGTDTRQIPSLPSPPLPFYLREQSSRTTLLT